MSTRAERRRAHKAAQKGRSVKFGDVDDRLKLAARQTPIQKDGTHEVERLVSVAFIRDGQTHHGFKGHYELRASVDPEDPSPAKNWRGDEPGFWTSAGRFVTREEAKIIGEASGQTRPQQRELLSSDIDW